MHFRVRKKVVQLIRTKYDDVRKRGVNAIIGTVNLAKPELSDDLRQKLTADEIDAYGTWVIARHRVDMLREEMAAMTLAETMSLAECWFEREGNSSAAKTVASDIVFHWQSMRKVFANSELLE